MAYLFGRQITSTAPPAPGAKSATTFRMVRTRSHACWGATQLTPMPTSRLRGRGDPASAAAAPSGSGDSPAGPYPAACSTRRAVVATSSPLAKAALLRHWKVMQYGTVASSAPINPTITSASRSSGIVSNTSKSAPGQPANTSARWRWKRVNTSRSIA